MHNWQKQQTFFPERSEGSIDFANAFFQFTYFREHCKPHDPSLRSGTMCSRAEDFSAQIGP